MDVTGQLSVGAFLGGLFVPQFLREGEAGGSLDKEQDAHESIRKLSCRERHDRKDKQCAAIDAQSLDLRLGINRLPALGKQKLLAGIMPNQHHPKENQHNSRLVHSFLFLTSHRLTRRGTDCSLI